MSPQQHIESAHPPHRILLALIGARRHYAIPRMLYEAGKLELFYTDICAVKGWPRLLHWLPNSWCPAPLKRLLGRVPVGIPPEKITAFTTFGITNNRRLARARSLSETVSVHEWAGKIFCQLILKRGLGEADAVYTFDRAGLELLRFARQHGLRTIMEQTVAPLVVDRRYADEEQIRFPEWELPVVFDGTMARFAEREQAEWREADLILCGSDFVREGITACGGPVEHCVVVPYGVDARFSIAERSVHTGPLRVLSVGKVGLRKGAPYILEAARRLKERAVFRMVGSIGVLPAAEAKLRQHLELTGPVPRSEIIQHYQWADVFLLPSLCEGSAGVVYEALAAGLPVICTYNTGSVVRDGIDGFIVPIRDSNAIVTCLERFLQESDLLAAQSAAARHRAGEFTREQYRQRLLAAINTLPGIPD